MPKYFTHEGKRSIYFYLTHALTYGCNSFKKDGLGPICKALVLVKKEISDIYYTTKDIYYLEVLKCYLKESKLIEKLVKRLKKERENLVNKLKKINQKDLAQLSNRDLFKIYKDSYNTLAFLFRTVSIIRRLDRGGMKTLIDWLSLKKIKDISEALTILCTTEKESFLGEEGRKFLLGLNKILKGKRLSKTVLRKSKTIDNFIQTHLDKYTWVSKSFYNEPARNKEYYFKEIDKIIKEKINIKEKLKYLINISKDVIKKRKKLLKKIKPPSKILKVIKILQYCSYLKDYNRASLGQIFYKLERFFAEIGKRVNFSAHDARTLTPLELKGLLVKNKYLNQTLIKKIRERKKYYIVISGKGAVREFYGQKARRLEKKYFQIKLKTLPKQLLGRVVSKGKGKGKVRIITSLKDLVKFKKGDILVANNTTPDFVPAMKIASAIIAEEGGITAHAAIVSRELGIPCVVGVNFATKVFRDGQLVEVDANKGIIRKI